MERKNENVRFLETVKIDEFVVDFNGAKKKCNSIISAILARTIFSLNSKSKYFKFSIVDVNNLLNLEPSLVMGEFKRLLDLEGVTRKYVSTNLVLPQGLGIANPKKHKYIDIEYWSKHQKKLFPKARDISSDDFVKFVERKLFPRQEQAASFEEKFFNYAVSPVIGTECSELLKTFLSGQGRYSIAMSMTKILDPSDFVSRAILTCLYYSLKFTLQDRKFPEYSTYTFDLLRDSPIFKTFIKRQTIKTILYLEGDVENTPNFFSEFFPWYNHKKNNRGIVPSQLKDLVHLTGIDNLNLPMKKTADDEKSVELSKKIETLNRVKDKKAVEVTLKKLRNELKRLKEIKTGNRTNYISGVGMIAYHWVKILQELVVKLFPEQDRLTIFHLDFYINRLYDQHFFSLSEKAFNTVVESGLEKINKDWYTSSLEQFVQVSKKESKFKFENDEGKLVGIEDKIEGGDYENFEGLIGEGEGDEEIVEEEKDFNFDEAVEEAAADLKEAKELEALTFSEIEIIQEDLKDLFKKNKLGEKDLIKIQKVSLKEDDLVKIVFDGKEYTISIKLYNQFKKKYPVQRKKRIFVEPMEEPMEELKVEDTSGQKLGGYKTFFNTLKSYKSPEKSKPEKPKRIAWGSPEKAVAPSEKAVAPSEKAVAPSEKAVAPSEKAFGKSIKSVFESDPFFASEWAIFCVSPFIGCSKPLGFKSQNRFYKFTKR